MQINKKKIIDNFKNINNLINYKFLVCYKKLFNKEGIIKKYRKLYNIINYYFPYNSNFYILFKTIFLNKEKN